MPAALCPFVSDSDLHSAINSCRRTLTLNKTKNYRISFRVEADEFAVLRQYAEQQRITKSRAVRRFIAEALGFQGSRDLGWIAERKRRQEMLQPLS